MLLPLLTNLVLDTLASPLRLSAGTHKAASKKSAARLDYDFNWSRWLAADDEIASAVVTISGPDGALTQPFDAIVATTYVVFWLEGGTAGRHYSVTCTVTTASSPARIGIATLAMQIVA